MGALVTAALLASLVVNPAGASHSGSQTVILPYDVSMPGTVDGPTTASSITLPGHEPECDSPGTSIVLFCEALEGDFNRVTIQVWDFGNPTPVPIGARYTFMDDQGTVVWQDVMCEHKNAFVPEGATQMRVEVAHSDSFEDEEHQYGVCGAAPFHGEVRLRFTHATPSPESDPECDDCPPCTCECEWHPVTGWECECGRN